MASFRFFTELIGSLLEQAWSPKIGARLIHVEPNKTS
jgi:hypothetical protein